MVTIARNDKPSTQSEPSRPDLRLTPRQHQVLRLLADGLSTREMAGTLQISEQAVRNQVQLLLAELRVRNRLEAVVVASCNNWL